MTRKMMPNVKGLLFVFFTVAVFVLGLTATLNAAGLTPYDTLTKGPINEAKWDKYEFLRKIDQIDSTTRMLQLGVRSGSGSTGPITNSVSIPHANAIMKISAIIAPIQFATSSGDGGATYAKAMAMVGGRFYNDGTAGAAPGSCLGDILAQVGIGNTPTSAEPKIMWSVVKYTSADCSATTVLESGVFTTDMITGTAALEYNEDRTFTFTYDNGTHYTAIFTDSVTPIVLGVNTIYKGMYVKVKDNAGLDASVFAHFGDVRFGGEPWDDFSADQIDTTKWNNPESIRKIDVKSKSLILLARGSVNSKAATENNLPVALPETVRTIRATVKPIELTITPNVTSTANALVYVGGRFFNDGSGGAGVYEGDIAAFIKLQVTKDGLQHVGKWKVVRFTGDTIDETETIAEGPDTPKPIVLNRPYTLSVGWDGSTFTFSGNKETFTYTPSLPVNPAKMPFRGLGAVISEGDVTGTAIAYFTNVMVDAPQTLTVDISGTGSVKSSPPGILCDDLNTPCSGAFPYAKKVTLTAKAGTGWVFDQWTYKSGTGMCARKTSCSVAMDDAKELQANFIKFPTLLFSPKSKNFGNVLAVSRTSTAVITVMNKTTKGVVPLEPGAMSVTGDTTEFDIQNDLCSGTTLAPNGKCTFKVVFQPQSPGAKSITVSFPSSNDPLSPALVLSGNGVQ